MRFTSRWMSKPCSQNLRGYNFTIKGKVERGRTTSLSFLHRRHVSIISFSPRLNKGVFLSLYGQASSTNNCFLCVQRAHPNLLGSMGRMWVSCHHSFTVGRMSCAFVIWFCCKARLLGFAVKQNCILE